MNKLRLISGHCGRVATLIMILLLSVVSACPASSKSTGNDKEDAEAHATAASVFINMPVEVLDLLKPSVRMDMVDYFEADSIYNAPNAMEGKSRLLALTDRYAKIEITPVSTLEIRLLPLKKSGDMIMTIYSIGTTEGVAADSDLRFFDDNFKEIERKKVIKTPEVHDFFNLGKDRKQKTKELDKIIPFPTMIMEGSPDNDQISVRLTSQGVADITEFEKYKDLMLPELIYEWDGSKMRASEKNR